MLRTPKARWIAVVLAAILTAAPAVPVLAAPADWTPTAIFVLLESWLDWGVCEDERRSRAASEVETPESNEDPAPADFAVGLDAFQGENSSDVAPEWDPDG